MNNTIICKINGVPDNYATMIFGRQLEFRHKIAEFKASAKSTWLSQKRQSWRKALKEFKALHNPTEYYASFSANKPDHWDDTFEIWYR
jgi:hypothetical protein